MSMVAQFISRIDSTALAIVATGALPLAVLTAWLIYKQVCRTRCRSVVDIEGQVRAGATSDLVEEIPTTPDAQRLRSALRDGDVVLVEAGQRIPADGRILEGVASVDESAVSGVSVRVLRGEGADCREVLAGSVVVGGRILVQVQHVGGEAIN